MSQAVDAFAKGVETELILTGHTSWILPKIGRPATKRPDARRQVPEPTSSRLSVERVAVITCLFNPVNDERIDRNHHRFAASLESQGIHPWTIELAFDGSNYRLKPGERVVQRRATSQLWQKERALNLLIQELPDKYEAIAWLDGDILFGDKQWIGELCDQLSQFPIVQCWSQAEFLDESDDVLDFRTSTARAAIENRPDCQSFQSGHPGLAWAARRELVAGNGLYDRHLTGGGDSLMAIAAYGWWQHRLLQRLSPAMQADFASWAQGWWNGIVGRVGALSGTVRHLWHGSLENRLYRERWDWLKELNFDPGTDIELDPQGLWRWTGRNLELERRLPAYFRWLRDSDMATSDDLARLAKSVNFAVEALET